MPKVIAFLKLVRWPNLALIVLAQSLFQFCIYRGIYASKVPEGDGEQFVLLVLASVCIAAAGNIINDYFDINIDLINKPNKVVLGRIIGRRWALVWHLLLSGAGIVLTAIALNPFERWYLVFANIGVVVLLLLYSMRFKRDVLIGNIIISLITAWVILLIFLSKYSLADAFQNVEYVQLKFFRFAILYSGFAFVVSLIREAVKDVEDLAGDKKYHCKTMPVVWGVNATKVYVGVWLTILLILLAVVQLYIIQFQWWWVVVYCVLAVIAPLVGIFIKLLSAKNAFHYHKISLLVKLAMLTGISSMIFFYIYL